MLSLTVFKIQSRKASYLHTELSTFEWASLPENSSYPQFKCLISTSAASPWGLGLHPLYKLQAMANQPMFSPNLSQESSHLEQQRPLCAFHTGSEKENTQQQRVHRGATQQHRAVLSGWGTCSPWAQQRAQQESSSSHLPPLIFSACIPGTHVSARVLLCHQIPSTQPPTPCWGGQSRGNRLKAENWRQRRWPKTNTY